MCFIRLLPHPRKIGLGVFILLASMSMTAVFANNLPVYTEANQTIRQEVNQPGFIIQLKSNPTTGYSWLLQTYDPKLIKLVQHRYVPPKQMLVGAGGVEQWEFQLTDAAFIAPQPIFIKLIYRRPWEDQSASKSAVFEITTGEKRE
jgi:predicted secreted protein